MDNMHYLNDGLWKVFRWLFPRLMVSLVGFCWLCFLSVSFFAIGKVKNMFVMIFIAL